MRKVELWRADDVGVDELVGTITEQDDGKLIADTPVAERALGVTVVTPIGPLNASSPHFLDWLQLHYKTPYFRATAPMP